MKKKVFRKLRALANEVLGKEETDKIIKEEIDKFLKENKYETQEEKPKKKKKAEK